MNGARTYVKQSLSQGNFLIVQKTILRYLEDANATLVLSNLVTLRDYFESINMLVENEWFFQTIDKMEYDLGLSSTKQTHAIKLLVERGLIEVRKMGRPCTRYFKVCDEAIAIVLGGSIVDTEKLERGKYYTTLNTCLNSDLPYIDVSKKARGNMKEDLLALLFCTTRALKPVHSTFTWTATEVGRIRSFYLKESANKSFDLPRYITAITNILHQKRNITISFDYITEMINQYYNTTPSTPTSVEALANLRPEEVVKFCEGKTR